MTKFYDFGKYYKRVFENDNMPQYDDSFMFDDSANQRRNKRSYRVSRKGLPPSSTHNGTYVLKNNINNLKHNRDFGSNHTLKENGYVDEVLYSKSANKSFPSLLDTKDIYNLKNNNYYAFTPGKSLEDLASNGHYLPLKNSNGLFGHARGKSLQNLTENPTTQTPCLPATAKCYSKSSSGYLSRARSKDSVGGYNHYIVNEGCSPDKSKSKRLYETNAKLKEKAALRLAARILESGVYRQLGKVRPDENDDSGFVDDNGLEGTEIVPSGGTLGTTGSSGHKASFRSANKLARRARSFKEDLLERISAMRSPGTPSTNSALPSLRSQSPLSPKGRGHQKSDDPESNPYKDLEILVRQIKFDLKHFTDVITKKKLEMLPGNGTIVLETITSINKVIKPYVCTLLSESPSGPLDSAQSRLCSAVVDLIRLCDECMILGDDELNKFNVTDITNEVQQAVEDLAAIAFERMNGGENVHQGKSNGAIGKDAKNLKLQVRPATDGIKNNNSEGQRNSLPDIPLTPRERQLLEGTGNGMPVRSSHSTESILNSMTTTPHQEPPPKPPIPIRIFDIAPPLPPKHKSNVNNSSHLSTGDRVSLQSHSSGSLDSMLNVSNDEEIQTIMDRNSTNLDDSSSTIDGAINFQPYNNNRLSQESNSTVCTTSSTCTGLNRLSNEIVPQSYPMFFNDSVGNQFTNHNRFSSESGFASMGNTRASDISYTSMNSSTMQNQKCVSFIDATPTPGDMQMTLLSELSMDGVVKMPSPTKPNLTSLAAVVQQTCKQISSSKTIIEQNSKVFSSSESNFFSNSSAFEYTQKEQSSQSFVKTQKTTIIDGSNITSVSSSNVSNSASSEVVKIDGSADVTDNVVPPALPVKTRKQSKFSDKSLNQSFPLFNTIVDDQVIELRDRMTSCVLHGQPEGVMQRPHTLIDQSLSSGQPPPLPMKKKHIMAYMEMFGNCSHTSQNSTDFLRHSLHEHHQHAAAHCMSSIQQFSNPSLTTIASNQAVFARNGQTMHGLTQNGHIITSSSLGYNQQLTQSHTLHHFNMSATNGNLSNQNLSGFSSPMRSPRLTSEDALKSDASSITSVSTNSSIPPVPSSPVLSTVPPALPPKRIKIKPTPNHSPAKPPLSPKPPQSAQNESSSPTTPAQLTCTTPLSGRNSSSPAPQFQFDPPAVSIDTSLLLNAEDEQWQRPNPNKPGKFPVDDIDLDSSTRPNSSPSNKEVDSSIDPETESEPDIILEMDVSSRIVWKPSAEEGPDIRGGHPDALIVHAIKSNKDFSYQEAFLTTYRTFVSPLELIEKLRRRHSYLVMNGKNTKAREVQSLLTRVVGDLTFADLDNDLLLIIVDFVYNLVRSVDLAMAKVLRSVIVDKYMNKKLMVQQQLTLNSCQWTTTTLVRSLLEQKAEAIAEQMTLLDAELFTMIPAPEALLWARDQCEERSPNLTRFTEHFNKMSYWARSRILEQSEAREREKYVLKFMKVMKHLRKMNNFNSYLALLSALESSPIRRLDWQKQITDGLKEYGALIDSSSSFRAYRTALAETQPPCIPYLGMVLQDLTFVHIGNPDQLPDNSINFSKRWQQYHILENMKRFSKAQYTFKKNEKIIAMFNGFDDILNEETLWQISESIKPRPGKG